MRQDFPAVFFCWDVTYQKMERYFSSGILKFEACFCKPNKSLKDVTDMPDSALQMQRFIFFLLSVPLIMGNAFLFTAILISFLLDRRRDRCLAKVHAKIVDQRMVQKGEEYYWYNTYSYSLMGMVYTVECMSAVPESEKGHIGDTAVIFCDPRRPTVIRTGEFQKSSNAAIRTLLWIGVICVAVGGGLTVVFLIKNFILL